MTAPIILDEETDATVADTATSTWVTVKNFAVYIVKTDEGIVVDIYAKDFEDCGKLDSAHAFDADATQIQADYDETAPGE